MPMTWSTSRRTPDRGADRATPSSRRTSPDWETGSTSPRRSKTPPPTRGGPWTWWGCSRSRSATAWMRATACRPSRRCARTARHGASRSSRSLPGRRRRRTMTDTTTVAETDTETDAAQHPEAFIAPVSMEDDPDELFPGDRGTLDPAVRRVLVHVLQHRFLRADNRAEWALLLEHQQIIESRMHDLYLRLVVDLGRGLAYKQQVRSDEIDVPI